MAKARRYQLTESVHGAAFVPCDMNGAKLTATEAPTLANWLATRAYLWQTRGYDFLCTGTPNQVTAINMRNQQGVVVRIEEVQS